MATEYTGKTGSLAEKRFAIIVSTYHRRITGPLLQGAEESLATAGVDDENVTIAWVPGAWELPLAAKKFIASSADWDAIICLGCVIRGETTHDQHINSTVSHNLGQLSIESGVPIAFGLLTCESLQQAIERSGGKVGNKGIEATDAAIRMVRLYDEIGQ